MQAESQLLLQKQAPANKVAVDGQAVQEVKDEDEVRHVLHEKWQLILNVNNYIDFIALIQQLNQLEQNKSAFIFKVQVDDSYLNYRNHQVMLE